jgi:hypothetical protein
MATLQRVTLVDDLDPQATANQTVVWAFGENAYEIDLSDENAGELRTLLQQYIEAGRLLSTGKTPENSRVSTRTPNREYDPKKVRVWARENGYQISDSGRLHQDLIRKYLEVRTEQ